MWRLTNLWLVMALVLAFTAGCSSGADGFAAFNYPTVSNPDASLDKNDYPVFPNADAGADPSVPAELGGAGFTGEGWETNLDFDLIGDPRAVKGGVLRGAMTDFPSTLRYYGPNRTAWNATLHNMAYESLLGMHPTTYEYIPALATHWQISPDRRTFRFRINPNARWSDGMPVIADDVVASWKLAVDPELQDPGISIVFGKFEEPVAESKYIVRVTTATENWRDFMYFSGMFIYPAHVLSGVDAATYITEYNYKMLPGSGPYTIHEADVNRGNSVAMRRRTDYWAEDHRRNVGTANFDEIRETVVRDRNLEFEMFKKGDLDYYVVNRAQMWVEDLDYDNIQRGLQQKRKIFNHSPNGIQGMAMNTRREPYNDIRVRRALRHLFNRESMIENLMYNEYELMHSLYPDSMYENPNNEQMLYDPEKAVQLLAEAGWNSRNSAGLLVKNGQPLVLEIVYGSASSERFLTVFQEDLRRVGITLNLRLVTFETLVKLLDELTFDMASIAYTGSSFPNPEFTFLSRLADETNSNNITGFKNARVDEIIAAYDKAFDLEERIALLQELDGIVTGQHHWILEWTAPYSRVVYWNRFGFPEGILSRTGSSSDLLSLWWFEPAKIEALSGALRDSSIQLDPGPTENRYWLDFAGAENMAAR